MKKLLFLAIAAITLFGVGCGANGDPAAAEGEDRVQTATASHKGFYYVLDATGRHLRSGHLPKDTSDEQWLLDLRAETTNAEILHIWLAQDFVTVEL